MADAQKPLTPSAIKYLLTLLEICQKDAGARCMDIAEQLRVTKPSVHSMIENLCAAGLAEKKKYGTVFLTPEGRMQAERYAVCCSLLRGRMHVDAAAELAEALLRLRVDGLPVDMQKPAVPERPGADAQIFRHREIRQQRGLLENGLDAPALRVARAGRAIGLPVQQDLSLARRMDARE